MKITYRCANDVSPRAALALHRRARWWDWYTLSDMRWRLEHALYVATAWHGRKMVGMALLSGDGRIDAALSVLLVDEPYRGQGIGTALMEKIIEEVRRLKPYCFGLDVFEKSVERFYRRFGFRKNAGTWLLEHGPTADRTKLRVREVRGGA